MASSVYGNSVTKGSLLRYITHKHPGVQSERSQHDSSQDRPTTSSYAPSLLVPVSDGSNSTYSTLHDDTLNQVTMSKLQESAPSNALDHNDTVCMNTTNITLDDEISTLANLHDDARQIYQENWDSIQTHSNVKKSLSTSMHTGQHVSLCCHVYL